MADKVILDKSILTGIGNAIREKKGTTELIPSLNMESEIRSIQGGADMLQQLVNAKGNCEYLFYGYKGSNLDSFVNLDTSNATSTKYMFNNCSNLTTIPLLDTSNVTDMTSMFTYCNKLTAIPLLNTSNVTTMRSMFNDCKILTTIPQLDTSNVTDMVSMFNLCRKLTTIPLLNTSNVTTMQNMFKYCDILKTIPALDTSNVTDMTSMFNGCIALTTIPALDVSKVTNTNGMFTNCPKLKSILMYSMKVSFNISVSTKFEQSDLVTILNNLATVTTTQTLTMGSTNLAKLTDEDKAIATNKNWTLA